MYNLQLLFGQGLDKFLLEDEAVDDVDLFFPKLNCSNPTRYDLSAFVKLW